MARLPRVPGLRRGGEPAEGASQPEPPPARVQPAAIRRPLPPAGQLRRERRVLLRAREERIRDLGGLVLEMVRRDQFRRDLVYDRTTELLALEERLRELDALLAAAVGARRARSVRCECGAPILWGSRFCASCGRPIAAELESGAPGEAEA